MSQVSTGMIICRLETDLDFLYANFRPLAHAVEDAALLEQVLWGIVFYSGTLVHDQNFIVRQNSPQSV